MAGILAQGTMLGVGEQGGSGLDGNNAYSPHSLILQNEIMDYTKRILRGGHRKSPGYPGKPSANTVDRGRPATDPGYELNLMELKKQKIIAATSLNLETAVKKGTFQQGLYYRLNVFTLTIVPLRKRPEDIMALSRFFLEQYNKEFDMSCTFEQLELDKLPRHGFPGNVRELQNIIKKAVVMDEANAINELLTNGKFQKNGNRSLKDIPPNQSLAQRVMAVERGMLLQALGKCRSTRSLATFLRTSQTSVVRKLKKYDLTHHLNRIKE